MTERNESLAQSLFEDALPDETAKLGVFLARFEGVARSSFEELIEVYPSVKAPTYASSFPITNRATGELVLGA